MTSIPEPQLLDALIPHLELAVRSAPSGRPHWSCLFYLADALRKSGRTEASLPFYEQAATEAAAAEDWRDVAPITGNWAIALRRAGHPDASRAKHRESADAERRAGRPLVNVLISELEAYRIDILQGRAAEVLPEVEQRIAQAESWWQRTRKQGESVPEAPDIEELGRALVAALDIAMSAYVAQRDWDAALRWIDRILEVERDLHRSAQDIGVTRMNRANILINLGRYEEARAELEPFLEVFAGNAALKLQVLGALATVFHEQGDLRQAVELQRRALAMCEQLPDPVHRATSHNNLAIYLAETDVPAARLESERHRLASLCYRVVAGLGADLQVSLRNYVVHFRIAKDAATPVVTPRLAELLALPAFRPLAQWLDQRGVNREALQSEIDRYLETARQTAES